MSKNELSLTKIPEAAESITQSAITEVNLNNAPHFPEPNNPLPQNKLTTSPLLIENIYIIYKPILALASVTALRNRRCTQRGERAGYEIQCSRFEAGSVDLHVAGRSSGDFWWRDLGC